MSVAIDLNEKTVLRVQNQIFALLHETISQLIEEKKIYFPALVEFLSRTDQNIYGPGAVFADIADHIKSKKDVLLFAELVKETIDLKYDSFNKFIGCIDHLHNFHQELLNYAEGLKE